MKMSLLGRRLIAVEWVGLFILVLVAGIIMSFVSSAFLSTYNLYVVNRDIATTLIIGFSQLIVLAVGQMNLSLGAIGGLVVVITGGLMEAWGMPVWVAVTAGLLVGAITGLLNGVLVVRTGINSFIVTIATASIYLGLNLGLTEAQPFYRLPKEFVALGQARFGALSHMAIITLAVTILMAILLNRSIPGRQLLATGGNLNAAESSGVPVNRVIVGAHVISGVLAAIAGILWMAQLGSAQPAIGASWLLPSFAVPIIGGVSLTGGSASIMGTVLAAFLITFIKNGVVHLQVDPYYVEFLLGLLILLAVGLDRLAKSRQQRVPREAITS